MPHYTKGSLGMLTDTVEFLPDRSAMQIEVVVTIPHVVDGDSVGVTFGIDQGEHSILALTQEMQRTGLVEQTVLPPHG